MIEPMGLLAWIVVGLVAGWLAAHIVPSPFGVIGDTLVGMAGALLGGLIFNELGAAGTTGLSIWSVFVAFVGAVVLLALIRIIKTKGA